jgi:cytochrome P450
MPITAVHNCQAYWERPEAFIPERFLEVCLPLLFLVSAHCGKLYDDAQLLST